MIHYIFYKKNIKDNWKLKRVLNKKDRNWFWNSYLKNVEMTECFDKKDFKEFQSLVKEVK